MTIRSMASMTAGGLALITGTLIGCSDDGGADTDQYQFASRFTSGESVSYSGQIARHAMIKGLGDRIGEIDSSIANLDTSFTPASSAAVFDELEPYYRSGVDTVPSIDGWEVSITTSPPVLQTTYGDISTGKHLVGKTAGNDTTTDHRDWSTSFAGFSTDLPTTMGEAPQGGWNPTALVDAFMWAIADQAHAEFVSVSPRMFGSTRIPVYVDDAGRDYDQLLEKFLLGAVAFSQGTDDYLDDGTAGKGLELTNARDEDEPFSELEHAWDEGFGYFGAARDYLDYTDDEIAGKPDDTTRPEYENGYHDADDDGRIDLTSEFNFGASVNAAKRDRGACVDPDFTQAAFEAFVEGRAIIADAGETLTSDERTALLDARDRAVAAWEKAIAATAVHYINELLADMDEFDYTGDVGGAGAYDFLSLAKHWSELKGFALSFQFSPHSPMTPTDFLTLHDLIGDAPVLEAEGETATDAYRADLLSARTLLQNTYAFATENVEGTDTCDPW